MHIAGIRIAGLRCFRDTGLIELSPTCNVFIGQNNAGKSTFLKAVLALQASGFVPQDYRRECPQRFFQIRICDVPNDIPMRHRTGDGTSFDIIRNISAPEIAPSQSYSRIYLGDDQPIFSPTRPGHALEYFFARRKTNGFNQQVNDNSAQQVTGNLNNLYARVDTLVSGHPKNAIFSQATKDIIGLSIATRSAQNGKEAGIYLDDDTFANFDRIGDGISEMVALIVELTLAKNKIFVLEEPETSLHPKALKALMGLVRRASRNNQFFIATHSNIVVRELASEQSTKTFHVAREGADVLAHSTVKEITADPLARQSIMRDLGYEFGDLELYDGWLFLEESSAERIVNDVLIPMFASKLRGRIRTFSSNGVTRLSDRVTDFQQLVTFVHLQPIYRDRLWVRVDSGEQGQRAVDLLRGKFNYLDDRHCALFSKSDFEYYYPSQFAAEATAVLQLPSGEARNTAKRELLQKVLHWSLDNADKAKDAWLETAGEVIEFLRDIERSIAN